MYKFSSCSTERISLTISLITEAIQKLRFSGGGNGETLTKPTHTLFFWKYPYQSFRKQPSYNTQTSLFLLFKLLVSDCCP